MKKFNLLDTIVSPVVTEKATILSEFNKMVFNISSFQSIFVHCLAFSENQKLLAQYPSYSLTVFASLFPTSSYS